MYYTLGFIFGILLALTIAFIAWCIHRKKHPDSGKYDERQIAARGKAFQAGFFTILISGAAVSIWEFLAEASLPGGAYVWHMCSLGLGICVFAVTAIFQDAYVGIYDKPARFIRMGIFFIIAMCLSGFANLTLARSESHVVAILNLAVAVMWVIIIAAMLIRQKMRASEDAE